jgi:hypothetical protein
MHGGSQCCLNNFLFQRSLSLCQRLAYPLLNQIEASVPASQDHDRDRGHDWNVPPEEFREVQRQGYHDGIEGARKDYDNHRRPDVNNRDEYRHPHVAPNAKGDYRDGFRRGYETAMDHMMHANGGPR